MDRRGFLKVLGVGGVFVVAAPQLVLPKARPSVGSDARIFVPPAGGWLLTADNSPLLANTGPWRQWSESWWRVEIERYVEPGEDAWGIPDHLVPVGDREGWLMDQSIDYMPAGAIRMRERYEGNGPAPTIPNDSRFLRVTVEQRPPREPLMWRLPSS